MILETSIQMRFADVDMLGHVNNVSQQHYFDVGKSDFIAQILRLPSYWKEEGLITAATNSSFLAQIRLQERVVVMTRVSKIGTKSFTLFQQIVGADNQEVKTESISVMVAFNFATQCSIPIPEAWRMCLFESME